MNKYQQVKNYVDDHFKYYAFYPFDIVLNMDTEEEETESTFVRRYKESNFRISLGSESQYDFRNNYINDFSSQIDLPSNNFQLNLTYKFN